MKIKNTRYIVGTLTFCALAPFTHAQCTETCDNENTALGYLALQKDPVFAFDTAIGFQALTDATGGDNTAVGTFAGINVLTGHDNTAVGTGVLGGLYYYDGAASFNTAIGSEALTGTNGNYNAAVGYGSLELNNQGAKNTASGANALMN